MTGCSNLWTSAKCSISCEVHLQHRSKVVQLSSSQVHQTVSDTSSATIKLKQNSPTTSNSTIPVQSVWSRIIYRLELLKSTFNAKDFICRLFWSISSHCGAFHFWNACRSSKSRKIHWVQGYSRSSMLTFLSNSSLMLLMITNMSVPVWNHFHARRASIGKITFFRGVPFFRPSFMGTSLTQGTKFCHEILDTLGYHTV